MANGTTPFSRRHHRVGAFILCQFLSTIRSKMRLRRFELVTMAAAQALKCTYCMLAHGAVLRKNFVTVQLPGRQSTGQMLRIPETKDPPPEAVALARPLKEACFFALFLFEPLVVFLVSHVASYLLLVQPDRRYAIAAAPEMISPVRFPPQVREVFEYSDCCLALENPHQ